MKNYMDKIILESIQSKNKVPKDLGNLIISATDNLYENKQDKKAKKTYNKYFKMVAGLCASIILTTGIVFAKDINDYIKTLFNLNAHGMGEQQIQSAILENYIQYDPSEYIKSNDIAYKLDYTLLNDINLIFSIDFITDFNIDEFDDLTISGLKIKDENDNQIYIDSEDEKIYTQNTACSIRYNKIQKSSNEISISITLIAPSFPNIENLYISFDKIILNTVINGKTNIKEIEGNYNLKLNLDSKFNNRDITTYSSNIQLNDANIDLENIVLTNTGLGITFSSLDYGCYGYQFKLLDSNNSELYSIKNDISSIKNSEEHFAWIDINDEVKELDVFILKIINLDGQVSSFIISKK